MSPAAMVIENDEEKVEGEVNGVHTLTMAPEERERTGDIVYCR